MSMIDGLCARAEALCREIAKQELADSPLYIVPQSRLPKRLGRTAVCNGYTDDSPNRTRTWDHFVNNRR